MEKIIYRSCYHPATQHEQDKLFDTEKEALKYALQNYEKINFIDKTKLRMTNTGWKVVSQKDLYCIPNGFLNGVQYMHDGKYVNGNMFAVVKDRQFIEANNGIINNGSSFKVGDTEYIGQIIFEGQDSANYFIAYPKTENGYDYDKAVKFTKVE